MLPLLLLALAAPANALVLQDPLSCPSESQLRTSLAQHAPNLEGQLQLKRTSSGEVRVSWATGARHFTRTLRLSPSDCTAAAETVALLVQAWQRALPTSARPDALSQAAQVQTHVTKPPPTPEPELVDAGPPPEPLVPTPEIPALDAGTPAAPEPPAPVVDAGAPPEPVAQPAEEPPPPDAGVVIAVAELPPEVHTEPPTTTAEPSIWHLDLGAEGRGALGLGLSEKYAAGALALELDRGDFGGQLDLAIDTAQHGDLAPGRATATRQTASLRGLIRIRPIATHPAFALRLTLGPMLERLAGTSAGYTSSNGTQTVYAPGLAAGLTAAETLGAVEVGIGPEFEVLSEQTHFQITNVGTVLSLPRAWAGLALGIRAQLF